MTTEFVPHLTSDHLAADDWNVFRTRFLIRARQLSEPLVFKDALGREHQGLPGDYLVQSSEGLFRIASQAIFEDVYVRLEQRPAEDFAASSQLQTRLANLPA